MPLFMFLAGFCFFYSVQKHKYTDSDSIRKGIAGKIKRLLIPFAFIAICWMIPVRTICNYKPWANLNWIQIVKCVFLGSDSGHLWFLPALFWVFAFSIFLFPHLKKKSSDLALLFVTFGGMIIASKLPSVLFLNHAMANFYWFYLGYEACKYGKQLEAINPKIKACVLALSVIGIILDVYYGGQRLVEGILVSFLLLSMFYLVSPKSCGNLCKSVSEKSMGIYLFHSPLIYFTYAYLADCSPVIVVLLNFVVDGMIAYALTHLFMNSKAKVLIGY